MNFVSTKVLEEDYDAESDYGEENWSDSKGNLDNVDQWLVTTIFVYFLAFYCWLTENQSWISKSIMYKDLFCVVNTVPITSIYNPHFTIG